MDRKSGIPGRLQVRCRSITRDICKIGSAKASEVQSTSIKITQPQLNAGNVNDPPYGAGPEEDVQMVAH